MFDKQKWAEELFAQNADSGRSLDPESSKILSQMFMIESPAFNRVDELHTDLLTEPLYKIITERAKVIDREISPTLGLWIMHLANGNIGQSIMLVHALSVLVPETKSLTLSHFCEKATPWYIPKDETMDNAWYKQKIDGVSAIDQPRLWI
jgi:hypothetical protein